MTEPAVSLAGGGRALPDASGNQGMFVREGAEYLVGAHRTHLARTRVGVEDVRGGYAAPRSGTLTCTKVGIGWLPRAGRNGSERLALHYAGVAGHEADGEELLNGGLNSSCASARRRGTQSGLFSWLNPTRTALIGGICALGAEFELYGRVAAPRGGYASPAAVAAGRRGERGARSPHRVVAVTAGYRACVCGL